MYDDFGADLIGLVDEDGNEYQFEILDQIEHNGRKFFALIPCADDDKQAIENDGEYYIMEEIIEEDDDSPVLADIEDDVLLDELADIFESHFDEMFDYGEEE